MADESQGYSTSTWAGMPKYACNRCAYDTTSLRSIKDHVRLAHVRLPVAAEGEQEASAPAEEAPKKVSSGKASKEEADK